MSKDELLARRETLQQFAKHPGYSLWLGMLEASAESAYAAMSKAPDAHNLAKNLGVHVTLTSLGNWVARELAQIEILLATNNT